ncbi:MAG: hypothetical protein V1907_00140 [Candidatus Kerfeldbacteria bacterium]
MRLRNVVLVLFIAVAALFPKPLTAQDGAVLRQRLFSIDEQPLVKMTPDVAGFIILGDRIIAFAPCSEYFRITSTPWGRHIAQSFDLSDDLAHPRCFVSIYNPRDYEIVIDESKAVPTGRVTDLGGGKIRITIRMSRAEYNRSPGLPKPTR